MQTRSLFFEPGTDVTIEMNGPDDSYSTRIEDVTAQTLVLAMPMRGQEFVSLPAGHPVTLVVARRLNPYFFETTVIASRESAYPSLVLRRPSDRDGVQRRAYSRVDVLIDARVWVESSGAYGPMLRATLVNVSAGGAMMVLARQGNMTSPRGSMVVDDGHADSLGILATRHDDDERMPILPGTGLLVRFALPLDVGPVLTGAETIRCWARAGEPESAVRLTARWTDLGETDRERLVKFVFLRERELRQKGAI